MGFVITIQSAVLHFDADGDHTQILLMQMGLQRRQ